MQDRRVYEFGQYLQFLDRLTVPVLAWRQSVVASQLYRCCVEWVFVDVDATHCIDLAHVNSRFVGCCLDGYFSALMQLDYSEARKLARFGVTFVVLRTPL